MAKKKLPAAVPNDKGVPLLQEQTIRVNVSAKSLRARDVEHSYSVKCWKKYSKGLIYLMMRCWF